MSLDENCPKKDFTLAKKFASMKFAASANSLAMRLALCFTLLLTAALPSLAQSESVLYNFGNNGSNPYNGLTLHDEKLYGTTFSGGTSNGGTVFELSFSGGVIKETVLFNFLPGSGGGFNPSSNVIFDSKGNLYGTTTNGGADGGGTVYELSPGSGNWTMTVLYSFLGGLGDPVAGLVMDKAGDLYGTTNPLPPGGGTVFELSPSSGGWTEQVIYQAGPPITAGLAMNATEHIFGVTTDYSDVNNSSEAFKLSPNGSGGWNSSVLHYFTGTPDGDYAEGTPVVDSVGDIYGTTYQGGTYGCGTVYQFFPNGRFGYKYNIAFSFQCGTGDGENPSGGLVLGARGHIYGTTYSGGKYGFGTVFELVPTIHTGEYVEKLLWSFNGTDGANPYFGTLIRDNVGNLYGTTLNGGSNGTGVAFKVTP